MHSRKYLLFVSVFFILCRPSLIAQAWSTQRLADMPMAITNNAVCEGYLSNGDTCVYSFGGIDSTLIWSGITQASFRYNLTTDSWDTIPSLPDSLGKIASYASRVHDTIYIIGGYYVDQNGNESSSNRVHRYVTTSNTFLADGANIPVPIDDQVQAVWRDSLIYVVTGWSNTGNVPNVQIYDPQNNSWQVGTPVPNTGQYKAFGAAGVITGDTIYYYGGATTGSNFPAQNTMRKGVIDPLNPTSITWSIVANPPQAKGYRTACLIDNGGWLHWVGGSEVSYNYNGIAYNGSGPVDISSWIRLLIIWPSQPGETPIIDSIPMDLRGSAYINPMQEWNRSYIVAGGMWSNQQVSNQTLLLGWEWLGSVAETQPENPWVAFPVPARNSIVVQLMDENADSAFFEIVDMQGRTVHAQAASGQVTTIQTDQLVDGVYCLMLHQNGLKSSRRIIIQH